MLLKKYKNWKLYGSVYLTLEMDEIQINLFSRFQP